MFPVKLQSEITFSLPHNSIAPPFSVAIFAVKLQLVIVPLDPIQDIAPADFAVFPVKLQLEI